MNPVAPAMSALVAMCQGYPAAARLTQQSWNSTVTFSGPNAPRFAFTLSL